MIHRFDTSEYNASSNLYYFAAMARLALPDLHPMLVDPDLAHLTHRVVI